ncbi:sensor domain-containing protein [Neobacillus sp. D3-1R]|uniref:sensor domain-containing protein n=1 Tax=Neobacillus sp. D3-1R TaxID=3445778 RepID=UPI003FA06F2F
MKQINDKTYKRKWITVFALLAIVEILDKIISIVFPIEGTMKLIIDTIFLVLTMGIIFWMLRGLDQTARELEKNKQRLKNIFDTLDVAIWSHDLKSNTLLITSGIEKLYGYSSEEFYADHSLWKKVIHPEDVPVLFEREQNFLRGQAATSVYRIIRPDGEVRWIQDRGIPILDSRRQIIDFTSVLFDITDRKESEDRYRSLVEMSPDFIAVYSRGKIDYINEAGCKLFGATKLEEMIGLPISRFVPQNILEQIKTVDLAVDEESTEIVRYEFQTLQLDGKSIEVEMSAMPIFYEGRLAKQVVGRDISQRKKAEKTIEYMAYFDALTGLPNRNRFRQYLNKVLMENKDQMQAVLFLDLDRFKIINDTKGHTVGDLILKKVANRLEFVVQKHGMVSRQGGDEFIILLENMDKDQVTTIAQQILDEFSTPLKLDHQEFYVTPSIGVSIYPTDGTDVETLIKLADTAMYLAKDLGKNNFQFYSSHLNGLSSRKMEMEHGLRKAIEQEQLDLFYQPQMDLSTSEMVGIEALIRWKHPEKGFIPPSEFIPLAEETGLIVPLGKWILQKACEQNKVWQDSGLAYVPIAVNISVRQLQDENFIDGVKEVLNRVGLQPSLLELEITESIMQNIEKSTVILNQLKELGVKISIDDFGTGYSSLSYLRHLPIDNIKIDKSFVDDIIDHSNQGSIVKTIIDMGHNLNFNVIAEGIENEEQVSFLRENACKIGQGYFYSKPLPAEQIQNFIHHINKKRIPIA